MAVSRLHSIGLVVFVHFILALGHSAGVAEVTIFHGMSDASAGVFLDSERFVATDDEGNVLRVYSLSEPSRPAAVCDLSSFLKTTDKNPEADIEGATLVGDRIYWITSHGRNKDGKERPNRYRFFATDIRRSGKDVSLVPVGRPCMELVPALLEASFARPLGLDAATRLGADLQKNRREKLAPKDRGLNIEALAASPDGKVMYIGFRNPRPLDAATGRPMTLIVPMINYREVIERGIRPQFGEPVLWDLGGSGLRSMEYIEAHAAYFLISGPHDEGSGFVQYRWSGDTGERPSEVRRLSGDFAPEALMPALDGRLFLLSDDGSRLVRISHPWECIAGELIDEATCQNKHLVDPARRTFRGMFVSP